MLRISTGKTEDVAYRCRAWRHDGPCRKARANRDGGRIRGGMEVHGGPFAYLVLTTDPLDYFPNHKRGENPPPPPDRAWTDLYGGWKCLWKRIRRTWQVREKYDGPCGRKRTRVLAQGADAYCAVVEETRNGWPHLNIIVAGGPFADAVQGEGWHRVHQELKPLAVACGFGLIVWVEPVARAEAISRYIAKLAGEASKASQVPVDAPRGFRRLRATKGFLPAVVKDPDLTGLLVDLETGCAVNQRAADAYYRILDLVHDVPRANEGLAAFTRAGERRREANRRSVERFLASVYGLAAPPPVQEVAVAG